MLVGVYCIELCSQMAYLLVVMVMAFWPFGPLPALACRPFVRCHRRSFARSVCLGDTEGIYSMHLNRWGQVRLGVGNCNSNSRLARGGPDNDIGHDHGHHGNSRGWLRSSQADHAWKPLHMWLLRRKGPQAMR